MKFRAPNGERTRRPHAGFTLAEVLAALVFMAIVIPVAVEGLQVATRAAQMGVRRAAAARVGERVLNELVATGQWRRGSQSGEAAEGTDVYRWDARVDSWQQAPLRLLTVRVVFPVQGEEYALYLATLVDASQ
ncbi:hypothetical protein G4L39_08365 [Limisphaera ngatamarikiensis]|jgi:type II secretory pathway pseudopilin PulG|uniref:Type II secretion system protein n=1 Tax=Limisphaera ngatamarikiensis TaxID=1324935 RepID=A0A6M1RVH2_9BACT|nr:hypothetical protein [Limisphaera ngatamarikiensis]NGO39411.1 hypothetical protein [Limisphaera ngatamarikiensis]